MKRFGVALICTAAMLVILHSITPHTHTNPYGTQNVTISQNEEDSGLMGFLQLVFHPDLGQEHLEHFQNEAGDLHILPPLAPVAAVPDLTPTEELNPAPKDSYQITYTEEVYLLLAPLRGPPHIA